MIYHVELASTAQRQFKKLTSNIQDKIWAVMENLALDPRPQGYKKLVSNLGCYRVRIGDYRIIYSINDKIITIFVLKIGHRRDVYR